MIRILFLTFTLSACNHITASNPMKLGGLIPEHTGYKEFCMRQPDDCALPVDKSTLKTLNDINRDINTAIKYKKETRDLWHLASQGEGDCEDYALRKRQTLRSLYPSYAPAFRIALLWTEKNQYHAVATIHTSAGVYVLDNRYPNIAPWKTLPYKWHMIETPGQKSWSKIIS